MKATIIIAILNIAMAGIIMLACYAEDPVKKQYDHLINDLCIEFNCDQEQVKEKFPELKDIEDRYIQLRKICCSRDRLLKDPSLHLTKSDIDFLRIKNDQIRQLEEEIRYKVNNFNKNFINS